MALFVAACIKATAIVNDKSTQSYCGAAAKRIANSPFCLSLVVVWNGIEEKKLWKLFICLRLARRRWTSISKHNRFGFSFHVWLWLFVLNNIMFSIFISFLLLMCECVDALPCIFMWHISHSTMFTSRNYYFGRSSCRRRLRAFYCAFVCCERAPSFTCPSIVHCMSMRLNGVCMRDQTKWVHVLLQLQRSANSREKYSKRTEQQQQQRRQPIQTNIEQNRKNSHKYLLLNYDFHYWIFSVLFSCCFAWKMFAFQIHRRSSRPPPTVSEIETTFSNLEWNRCVTLNETRQHRLRNGTKRCRLLPRQSSH